jgi:hypothetical protein
VRQLQHPLLGGFRPAPITRQRPPRRLTTRAEQLRLVRERERRLVRRIRDLFAELRSSITLDEFRFLWVTQSVPEVLRQRQAAILERHAEAMVQALAVPVLLKQFPDPTPATMEQIARFRIGELVRELEPRQFLTLQRQLAVLMEQGPRAQVLDAIASTVGLTDRQVQAVANVAERTLRETGDQTAALRAAKATARRLLDYRSRLIARTEAVNFTNAVLLERARQLGAGTTKAWISARDKDVDVKLCRPLDNSARIPVTELFVVPSGPAKGRTFAAPTAHPGCRCILEIWRN